MMFVFVSFFKAHLGAGTFLRPFMASVSLAFPDVEIKEIRPAKNIRSLAGLLVYLLKNRNEAFIFEYGGLILVSLILCRKSVVVLRGSDCYRIGYGSKIAMFRSFLVAGCTRLFIRKASRVIVMSNDMRELLLRSATRILVLPDPVDTSLFSVALESDKYKLREKHGLKRNVYYAGFVSFSSSNVIKRYDLAQDCIDEVSRQLGVEIEIFIMSGVSYIDIPKYYQMLDVVLLTSLYEGWPNCIKEGLLSGVPFVATRVSDLAEVAAELNGCFVCEHSKESIVEGLTKWFRYKENGLISSEDLRDYAIKKFCLSHHARLLRDFMLDIV